MKKLKTNHYHPSTIATLNKLLIKKNYKFGRLTNTQGNTKCVKQPPPD